MTSKTKSAVDDISVQTKGYVPHSVPDLNLLPFSFKNYSGSAKISQFFVIEAIPEQDHVPGYLKSFFRGKEVRGTKINIPKNYTGLIVREKQSKDEDDQLGMEEEEEQENKSKNKSKNWTIVNAQENEDAEEDLLKGKRIFQEFHYWNREVTPSKNDRIHKWFKWMDLSENIHAAVSKADLEKYSLPTPHSKVETTMQFNKKEIQEPEMQVTKEDETLETESLPPKRRITSEKQEQTSKKKKT